MLRRIPEVVLVVLLAIGGYQAWTTGLERSRLQQDHDRLIEATGDLPIGDPSRVHLRTLPTGEPLHYAWRMYIPANYKFRYRCSGGSGGGSGVSGASQVMTESREFIARLRIREVDGRMNVFLQFPGGSSGCSLGDSATAEFLRGREAKILVEQLGSAGVVTLGPDDPIELLKLTVPDDLVGDANRILSPGERFLIPRLLEVDLGNPKPEPPQNPGKSKP